MKPNAIPWLRASYWAGALVDLIAGLMMLFPAISIVSKPADSFSPTPAYRYAMGMGAPLMLAWTILLVWADRKPVERRGVLPITILVVLGEVLNQIVAAKTGYITATALIPTFAIQALLTILFGFSYLYSKRGSAHDCSN